MSDVICMSRIKDFANGIINGLFIILSLTVLHHNENFGSFLQIMVFVICLLISFVIFDDEPQDLENKRLHEEIELLNEKLNLIYKNIKFEN